MLKEIAPSVRYLATSPGFCNFSCMSTLIDITEFDSFQRIKNVDARDVRNPAINTIKKLDEKTQLEPFVRACIYDLNDTPHGPVEIVDILTTKITYALAGVPQPSRCSVLL